MTTSVEAAAIAAAVLMAGVAIFQLALAFGAPLGDATLGGRATTINGTLSAGFRGLAVAQVAVIVTAAWIVLVRAGLATAPMSTGFVATATWVIAGFMLLNTLGNAAASHPIERWAMGPAALAVAALCGFVAWRAPAL